MTHDQEAHMEVEQTSQCPRCNGYGVVRGYQKDVAIAFPKCKQCDGTGFIQSAPDKKETVLCDMDHSEDDSTPVAVTHTRDGFHLCESCAEDAQYVAE